MGCQIHLNAKNEMSYTINGDLETWQKVLNLLSHFDALVVVMCSRRIIVPRLKIEFPSMQIFQNVYCAQGLGVAPNYAYSSIYYKGIARHGSPPWRPDDKDGHYVFAIGEALTPRCKYIYSC